MNLFARYRATIVHLQLIIERALGINDGLGALPIAAHVVASLRTFPGA
jgi:hypothetical protein